MISPGFRWSWPLCCLAPSNCVAESLCFPSLSACIQWGSAFGSCGYPHRSPCSSVRGISSRNRRDQQRDDEGPSHGGSQSSKPTIRLLQNTYQRADEQPGTSSNLSARKGPNAAHANGRLRIGTLGSSPRQSHPRGSHHRRPRKLTQDRTSPYRRSDPVPNARPRYLCLEQLSLFEAR